MNIIRTGYTNVLNMFKTFTDLQKLHSREEHCSNWLSLSLSLPEWHGMIPWTNTNYVEWSIRARSAVDLAQWDLGIEMDWSMTGLPNIWFVLTAVHTTSSAIDIKREDLRYINWPIYILSMHSKLATTQHTWGLKVWHLWLSVMHES